MSSNWRIDWTRPLTDRRDLADKICSLLLQDGRVETSELFGSLTSSEPDGFPADELSDIDIHVSVRSGTDRALYESLEEILIAGRLRPLAKNLFVGSQGIVANFMFEGYSPFWSVDIVCRASVRESCADLLEGSIPVRAFGSWLSAVKKSIRADTFLGFFTDIVPDTSVDVLHRPHELFSTLLDEWMSRYNDPLRYEIGREVLQHVYSRGV